MNKFLQKVMLLSLVMWASIAYSQEYEITLNPDKDSYVDNLNYSIGKGGTVDHRDTNYGTSIDFPSSHWSESGYWYNIRSLIEFDLSQIPEHAIITEATLTISGNGHNPLNRSNESYFYRVTESWSETTVTWNNQPSTIDDDKVYVQASTSSTQVYSLDFKDMVQSWIDGYYTNNGIMLKLVDESTSSYTKLLFASSDHTDTTLIPELNIKYILPYKITLYPDKDAYIKYLYGRVPKGTETYYDTNFGTSTMIESSQWTDNGNWYNSRSLLQFDLDSLPDHVVIEKAKLTLSGNGHNSTRSNASYLHRITDTWAEGMVTWRTQPGYVNNSSSISLPASQTTTDVYKINVKDFIDGWYNEDYSNYGLMMMLQDEQPSTPDYAKLNFASSDHTTSSIRPKLEIYYTEPLRLTMNPTELTDSTLGSITLTVGGGKTPYTYLWESGEDYSDLYDCWPGEYKVVVTDSIGDTIADSLYLNAPIHWIDTNYVDVDSTTIQKNNSTTSWDAGAESASLFKSGTFGQVFYSSEAQSTQRAFGLAKPSEAMTLNGMTYAFYFNGTNVSIYENGTSKKNLGTYSASETFKIVTEGTTIKYYRGTTMERSVTIIATDLVPRAVFYTDQAYFTDIRTSSLYYTNIAINTKSLEEGFTYKITSEDISSTESTGIQSAFWVNPIASTEDRLFSLTFHDIEGEDHTFVRFEMDNTYVIKDVEMKVNSVWQAMPTQMYAISNNSISFYSSSQQEEGTAQQAGPILSLENGEVLSPDGDESYDELEVSGVDHVRTYQIIISDTQGNAVYTSTDINTDWDGISDVTSSLVPVGTYRYKITVNDIEFNGIFNVIY